MASIGINRATAPTGSRSSKEITADMIRKTFLAAFALLLFSIATMTFWAAGRSDVADAAMKGDKAALRTLIQQKADVDARQVDGATAMHWAVYHLDPEAVDLLIKAGAKVD